MPLKKIADIPKPCQHPEHNPPGHIVLSPGVYEYSCPACGRKMSFSVPARFCRGVAIHGDSYTQYFSDGVQSKITIGPDREPPA